MNIINIKLGDLLMGPVPARMLNLIVTPLRLLCYTSHQYLKVISVK